MFYTNYQASKHLFNNFHPGYTQAKHHLFVPISLRWKQ